MQEVKNFLDNLDIKSLNMVCAHMMGACKIGNKFDSVVDLDGGVKNFKNIKVFDSSIIPENIGESPQLSIMSIVREIMQQNQN